MTHSLENSTRRPPRGGGAQPSSRTHSPSIAGLQAQAVTSPPPPTRRLPSASQLRPSEVDEVKELFDAHAPIDTYATLQSVLATVGLHILDDDIAAVSTANGFENGTVLRLEALLGIMGDLKRAHLRQIVDDIQAAFLALSNGGDSIHADQFRDVARSFKLTVDVEALLREADEDGSGVLEFEEFEKMIEMIEVMATPTGSPTQPGLEGAIAESSAVDAGDVDATRQLIARVKTLLPGGGRGASLHHHHNGNANNNNNNNGSHHRFDLAAAMARDADSEDGDSTARGDSAANTAALDGAPNAMGGDLRALLDPDDRVGGGSIGSSLLVMRGRTKSEAAEKFEERLKRANSGGHDGDAGSAANKKPGSVAALNKAALLSRPRTEIVIVDATTGAKKVLKLPQEPSPGRDPSRLYNARAPQWRVNYANFVYK